MQKQKIKNSSGGGRSGTTASERDDFVDYFHFAKRKKKNVCVVPGVVQNLQYCISYKQ